MKSDLLKNRTETLLSTAFILFWLIFLKNSDAYFSPYLLVGAAGIFCAFFRDPELQDSLSPGNRFAVVLSGLFSLAVAAANYKLFTKPAFSEVSGSVSLIVYSTVALILCLAGGFLAAWNILQLVRERKNRSWKVFTSPQISEPRSPAAVFFVTTLILIAIDCSILFLAKYPGLLTEDSISQIEQLMSGVYSNHHPYYHTMMIRACIRFGLFVFPGNFNAAVAVYSVFQIILISSAFGYVLSTLHRMGISGRLLLLCLVFYAILPCHVLYSFTMWKDIPFSASVTVFSVTLYRMLKEIGRRSPGLWTLLILSGLGSCLLRSNGWLTFFFAFPVFVLFFRREEKKLCLVFFCILLFSFILKNPVLNAIGVSKTDTIESLSIPAQQIARVIKEDKDSLTPDQRELLDRVVDVDHVPLWYSEFISNPVKDLVRATGDQEYLKTHIGEYLKIYLEIGLSHPKQYFEAWVEETKGYWNSGYDYWIISDMVSDNLFGITRTTVSPAVNSLTNQYIYLFRTSEFLRTFQSIGLSVWLSIFFAYVSYVRRNRAAMFLFVPLIVYLMSLYVGTPVFAEFRYTYAIFCLLPFFAFSSYYNDKEVSHG